MKILRGLPRGVFSLYPAVIQTLAELAVHHSRESSTRLTKETSAKDYFSPAEKAVSRPFERINLLFT